MCIVNTNISQIEMNYAILIECDDKQTLGGSCFRDVCNVATALKVRMKYASANIFMCLSSEVNVTSAKKKGYVNAFVASKATLLSIIQKIVTCSLGNELSLYMHISGHGYQCRDIGSLDEQDGYDEYVVLGSQERMKDDELNILLRQGVPKSCRLRVSIDTCHSGTLCDFSYENNVFNLHSVPFFSDALSVSACADNELDNCDVGDVVGYGGVLTIHMLEVPSAFETFLASREPWKVSQMLKPILAKCNQKITICSDHSY